MICVFFNLEICTLFTISVRVFGTGMLCGGGGGVGGGSVGAGEVFVGGGGGLSSNNHFR